MCSRIDETINYFITECTKLVQKGYKRRHDLLEQTIIGKLEEWKESMLKSNGTNINQKQSLRMTCVKSFGILLYRKAIL